MLSWLRRRRLSEPARRRMLIALARSEEAIVETHIENVVDLLDAVGDEMSLEKALELYLDTMAPGDARAEIIARRLISRLRDRGEWPRSSRKNRRGDAAV